MPIILYPDPRLGRAATPRPVDEALRATGARLLQAAVDAPAYGLAAAHIGEVEPVVVISAEPDPTQKSYMLLFNADVVAVAESTAPGPEGSVSLPGVHIEVNRPVWADIAFDDAGGTRHTQRFEGLPARIVQHEIEQMNGVFFLNRLSRVKRDMVLRKWKKRAG